MNCEKNGMILPEKLKRIEVDAESGKISINGEEMGGGIASFSFSCDPGGDDGRYIISAQTDSFMHLAGYDAVGRRIWEGRYKIRNIVRRVRRRSGSELSKKGNENNGACKGMRI